MLRLIMVPMLDMKSLIAGVRTKNVLESESDVVDNDVDDGGDKASAANDNSDSDDEHEDDGDDINTMTILLMMLGIMTMASMLIRKNPMATMTVRM